MKNVKKMTRTMQDYVASLYGKDYTKKIKYFIKNTPESIIVCDVNGGGQREIPKVDEDGAKLPGIYF